MNLLKKEKQERVIAALAEGCSIRGIERQTGVHRDTITRLAERIGRGCTNIMDALMRNLHIKRVQIDEAWTFCVKKERHLAPQDDHDRMGDFWIWVALDADTKLVPVFRVSKRDASDATALLADLAKRVTGRIQISTDGLSSYIAAIEDAFGSDADYGQIVKTFEQDHIGPGRYAPPRIDRITRSTIQGAPERKHISTSYVEKQNHTLRQHVRRMTRLTNAFSKKHENLRAAVGLHYAYYNFVKIHTSLRMTPALKAGVTRKLWTTGELMAEAENFC